MARRKTASVSDFLGGVLFYLCCLFFQFPKTHGWCQAAPGAEKTPGTLVPKPGWWRPEVPTLAQHPRPAQPAHSARPPPGRDTRPRATEAQLRGPHRSGPRRSPVKRELEKPPSRLSAQLLQWRIELFSCDFKIKHILKERRRFAIWLSGGSSQRPGRQGSQQSEEEQGSNLGFARD